MDRLRNLQQMATHACERFEQYDGEDFILPQKFKDNVKEINSNIITYNKYSAVIETRGTQHGVLNIYMPNQWFYVASYFTDLYNELQKYKSYALKVTTKERLKTLNGNSITLPEQNAINRLSLDENSKDNLVRFMTDYSWWNGAKTIDRGDFYVSPILYNAKLVNASQSFVADLCAFLANQQELVKAIIDKEEYDHRYTDSVIIYDGQYSQFRDYLTAIKSKPFLLLAGMSGTGKSRIVREFAFKSCPKYLQDKDGTTPGNYCMIEVKPNWHDSTELLGYYSNLSKGYQFKKFVKFLVKAKMNSDVPFFVCLDEMNLAPVEQYFAEILSILETRKHPKNAETGDVDMHIIKTETLIDSSFFKELKWIDDNNAVHVKTNMTDMNWYTEFFEVEKESEEEKQIKKYQYSRTLQEEGLKLPHNVIIIGTVNMDDTTHQFSRKVIDRAMTIEMNGGKLADMFGGSKDLEYTEDEAEQQKWQHAFAQRYVTADEVLEAHSEYAEEIKKELPSRLETINNALKGTPFEVSYRVLNEFTIMVGVMLDENRGMELDDIINQALNNILLMKILPRIEGDAEMFALSRDYKEKMGITYNNRLEWLKELAPDIREVSTKEIPEDEDDAKSPDESKEHQQTAKEKIQEMIDRLNNQEYTRFWP